MRQTKPDRSGSVGNLKRIADALGQSVETFFLPGGNPTRAAETAAMVESFNALLEGEARARCLAFIAAEVERTRKS